MKKETKEEPEYSLPSADFNINLELIRFRSVAFWCGNSLCEPQVGPGNPPPKIFTTQKSNF